MGVLNLGLPEDTRELMYTLAALGQQDLKEVETLIRAANAGRLAEEGADRLLALTGSSNIDKLSLAYHSLTGRRTR